MAALPYMQLYVADYLADTMHLTTEEHGAYLLLIMNYWQTGKPLQVNRLQSISKLSNKRWTDVERTLNEYFTVSDGEWHHDRVEFELSKVRAKSAQASKAGKASAAARSTGQEKQALSTDVQRGVSTALNHTDTEADTDTKHKKKYIPPVPDGVDPDLWKEYLKTRTKLKAPNTERAINTLTNKLVKLVDKGSLANDLIEIANSNGWKSVYEPNDKKTSDQKFRTMDNDQLYAEATRLGIPTQGKSTFDLRAALEAAV